MDFCEKPRATPAAKPPFLLETSYCASPSLAALVPRAARVGLPPYVPSLLPLPSARPDCCCAGKGCGSKIKQSPVAAAAEQAQTRYRRAQLLRQSVLSRLLGQSWAKRASKRRWQRQRDTLV